MFAKNLHKKFICGIFVEKIEGDNRDSEAIRPSVKRGGQENEDSKKT